MAGGGICSVVPQESTWYEHKSSAASKQAQAWRDAFLLHSPSGVSYLYFASHRPRPPSSAPHFRMCASKTDCVEDWFRGVIGVARHRPGREGWELLAPAADIRVLTPMVAPGDGKETVVLNMTAYWEMERPWVVLRGSTYHMFFHCWPGMVHPHFSESFWPTGTAGQHQVESSLYHLISSRPEGPFSLPHRDHFVVRGSRESGLYGTSIFELDGETALGGWFHKNHTLEVSGRFRLRWGPADVPIVHDTWASIAPP